MQSVSSGLKPTNKVPINDNFKTRILKVEKPDKEEAIRERLKRSCFGTSQQK
jgi:hypothetical protein